MEVWTFDAEKLIRDLEKLAEPPPLTLGLIDIDDFKFVNDTYARSTGDRLLEAVTVAFNKSIPKEYVFERIGGDAFLLTMPETTPEGALIFLEGVRVQVSRQGLKSGSKKIPVSLSIGISSYPQHVEDVSLLHAAAVEALERAKREGKGRVAIYVEDKMVLKSNYYTRGQLSRLASFAERLSRTEASLLREALNDVLEKYRDAS